MNEATAELNDMRLKLSRTSGELDDFGSSADDSRGAVSGLSFSLGESGLGGVLAGLGVGAAIAGVKQLTSTLLGIEEGTREYRSMMASLEISSQAAGYSAQQTAETYKLLYSVLGDAQPSATATANLQAIGLEQTMLTELTYGAIGAWAKYGDSIPIDALSEAINETIQVGTVTGNFADVLTWAGVNEDEFNTKLQSANSTAERANIVLQQLVDQGLTQAGKAWREQNEDLVAINEANAKLEEAWGRMGSLLAPLAADILDFCAEALQLLIDKLTDAIALFKTLDEQRSKVPAASTVGDYFPTVDSSFESGLKRVPFDGFIAELHRDEMVLPAEQAESMRQLMDAPETGGADFAAVASGMVNGIQTALTGMGGTYRVEIPVIIGTREFYRLTIDDLRAVMRSDPEVESGVWRRLF